VLYYLWLCGYRKYLQSSWKADGTIPLYEAVVFTGVEAEIFACCS
jgi:hypothetical protein